MAHVQTEASLNWSLAWWGHWIIWWRHLPACSGVRSKKVTWKCSQGGGGGGITSQAADVSIAFLSSVCSHSPPQALNQATGVPIYCYLTLVQGSVGGCCNVPHRGYRRGFINQMNGSTSPELSVLMRNRSRNHWTKPLGCLWSRSFKKGMKGWAEHILIFQLFLSR